MVTGGNSFRSIVHIEEKSNEIPAAQQLLGELQVAHRTGRETLASSGSHCSAIPLQLAPVPHRHRLT